MNDSASEELVYAYKPRLMGPAFEYRLARDGLDWQIGPRSGRVSYPMIRHVRLGYKPTNLATSRYIAEIWPANAPKLSLASTSARSLVDSSEHRDEYRHFIEELHRRIAAARGECTFDAGFPAWRWWPAAVIGLATAMAVIYIVVQGVRGGQALVAGLIALVSVWFLWQIWNIVIRNRPRTYTPDAIPQDVLPPAVMR
jgi:hypothetical protein